MNSIRSTNKYLLQRNKHQILQKPILKRNLSQMRDTTLRRNQQVLEGMRLDLVLTHLNFNYENQSGIQVMWLGKASSKDMILLFQTQSRNIKSNLVSKSHQ